MSNKISGFTVTFEKGLSEEYMDKVKASILLIKGVIDVNPEHEDVSTFLGISQESMRIKKILINLVRSDFKEIIEP
jgi:hypothetical protein